MVLLPQVVRLHGRFFLWWALRYPLARFLLRQLRRFDRRCRTLPWLPVGCWQQFRMP